MLPWRKRDDDYVDDGEDAEILPIRGEIEVVDEDPDETDEPGTELEPWAPRSALALRVAAVADRSILPPREHLTAALSWYGRSLWRDTCWLATHPLHLPARELRPIAQGVRVTWTAWRDWVTEAELAEAIEVAPKDSASRLTLSKQRAEARSGHRRMSFIVALLVLVALVTCWIIWPYAWLERWPVPQWLVEMPLVPDWLAAPWFVPDWLLVGGIVLAATFDVVGRRHPDLDAPPPPVKRHLLQEGMPLRSLGDSVVQRLNEEGIRADLASQVVAHPGGEYRALITHEDEIAPKHLRSLERALAGRPISFRLVGTDDAGTSELRMPTRDHLARVPSRRWAETGSRSIADPAPLWLRSDGDPSMPVLAGVHIDGVGTTGAGKTEALQEMISHAGECKDSYPIFIDLTRGPVGPLNRRVLRKQAYTVEEAEELLDWWLEQIEERHLILHRLAESDDDDAPVEWDLRWGPQIDLFIDEYSFLAEYDGTNGKPDLHGKVERGMRVGRKVKCCVRRWSQRSGNKDMGSTVAQALVGLKILMACTERDTTTMLSTQHRDRGWTPHEFRPAVPGDARDAGKCFVWGPGHRDPEIHRFHAPLEPGEIKRRDRARHADGLPNLDGRPMGEEMAMLLTPTQKAVEQVFAARQADWLPTALILAQLESDYAIVIDAAKLGVELGSRDGCKVGSSEEWDFDDGKGPRKTRGYRLSDVHAAWGAAE